MITNSKIKRSIFVLLVLTFMSLILVSAEDIYQVKMSIISPTPVNYESFGGGVTLNSDLIIVGAPKGSSGGQVDAGIVYVYNLEGEYKYSIESPNPQPQAKFGESMTCNNNYIIIGACQENVDSKTEAGKVYIYDIHGNLLHQIQSPEPGYQAHFGSTMAIYGDNIIVADEYMPDSLVNGKAYVFSTDGILKTTIAPPVPMRATLFGVSPRISSDYIVISEDVLSQVHIYSSDGTYLRTIESPLYNGQFGICTAINGDKIIIGESDANLVHIYDFNGNLVHTITPPEGHRGDFGFYVDSEGDLIIISEPKGVVDGVSGAGYVFIYDMDGNLISMIQSPDPQKDAGLGGGQYPRSLLSIKDNRIIVGEYHYDNGDLTDAGRVHLIEKGSFLVSLSDLSVEPSQIIIGESAMCSLKCSNEGTFGGQYKLVLKVDGQVKEEKMISLEAGKSETVSFELSGETEGEFNIDVNGETTSFVVKKAQTGVSGFPLLSIALGLISTYLVLLIIKQKTNLF